MLPFIFLLSATALLTGQLLLHTIMQQRILQSYAQNLTIVQELENDLENLKNSQELKYSLITTRQNVYLPDDPNPECKSGTWLYKVTLTHRTNSTYSLLVILSQRVNYSLGLFGSLYILAVHC